jgi:YegS/Rv2252/BmrU family lipid kinase
LSTKAEEKKTGFGADVPTAQAIRRVALIYNPASGQSFNHKSSVIDDALAVLQGAGIEAEAIATTAPGSAAAQVRGAVERGCDAVLACGGDGTAHEVMQSLVGTNTALGVVPLGTANALASDLGLPLSPLKAVEALLKAARVRIPAGRIFYRDSTGAERSRYFTVAAGIGADAHLMYSLDAKLKRQFGYALYAVEGLRVLTTHSFPAFEAAFTELGSSKPRVEEVSQLLAVRIRNFGGMLQNFAPGATLLNHNLRLVAFKTRKRFDYLRFLAAVVFRRQTFNGKIELLDAVSVECRPRNRSHAQVFVEADGEFLGGLPVRIEIVPDALTVLVPPQAAP